MRLRWLLLISLSGCAATAGLLSRPEVVPPPIVAYQETRFGIGASDPYRWMEEPAREQEMVAWVRAMSDASTAQLRGLPERAAFARLLEESTRAGTTYSDLNSANGKLFYRRQLPGDRVPSLVVRDGSSERVLLDPAAGTTEVVAIGNYTVSPDGATVAVHVAKGGGEVGETRFIDVATGRQQGNALSPIWGEFRVHWIAPDLVGYTRITVSSPGADSMKDMQAFVVKPGEAGPGRVALGRDVAGSPTYAAQEFPLFFKPKTSGLVFGLGVGARADQRIFVARAAALAAGSPAWHEVARYEDRVADVAAIDDDLYVLSTLGASNGQVLHRRLTDSGVTPPDTVLAEGALVLVGLEATRDGVWVAAQRDGIAQLLFLARGKGPARQVALPFDGDLSNLRVDADGGSVVFGLNGWTRATTFYRATGGRVEPLGIESESWKRAAELTTVREEALSADGTRVPMVVILPPGGKRSAMPTLLEGYGSYGALTVSPWYSPFWLPWAVHGGALAYCGTRGGGERGRLWHDSGRAANKANAQADFIACAERLQEARYATPQTLTAFGTSAGGLLVPPAVIKRPELFTALIPRVAILNATRLGAAPNGANQFAEMGDPETAEGYRGLASQDAYLMLGEAKDIPDTLITVGLNDKRVAPWMAAKFAARASQRFGARRLVLVRADAEAGHGVGSARDVQIAEFADVLAFARDRSSK
jgi:prolyl oligopeptidase